MFFSFYKVGAWYPLFGPLGCLGHPAAVMALMVLNLNPQYLQVYWGFSVPSYTLWKPLFGPSGCRGHLAEVRALTLVKFIPQYSQ